MKKERTKCFALKVELEDGTIKDCGITLEKERAEERKENLEAQGYKVLPIVEEDLYQ